MKALITGASGGLGKDFAVHLSNMGYDLVLVARSKSKLITLKKELKTKVEIEVMDLTNLTNILILFKKYRNVDLLINNAGFGKVDMFEDVDINEIKKMIDLNITALTELTFYFYKKFLQKNHGRIINIGSIAGYFPGPIFSTYYASKAYVNTFTTALAYESKIIKKSNVRVVLISPGSIKTNFSKNASNKRKNEGRSSYIFTKKAIKKAIVTNKHTVIIGRDKFAYFLSIILPFRVKLWLLTKVQRKKFV